MPSADALEAVTVDAAGTIVELADPVEPLGRALARRGVAREAETVRRAFAAEVAYYLPRSHEGRDEASLVNLRRESVRVFLDAVAAPLDAEAFVPDFMAAIEFRPLDGAAAALETLRAAGLRLACVANWDVTLAEHLERAGLAGFFEAVVSSAEAGAPKPDPAPFRLALERLDVAAGRALHVGDDPADREGARAAGLAFAPAPVVTLPARLGIG
jgi:putative hydrolase of the HAD superfamily